MGRGEGARRVLRVIGIVVFLTLTIGGVWLSAPAQAVEKIFTVREMGGDKQRTEGGGYSKCRVSNVVGNPEVNVNGSRCTINNEDDTWVFTARWAECEFTCEVLPDTWPGIDNLSTAAPGPNPDKASSPLEWAASNIKSLFGSGVFASLFLLWLTRPCLRISLRQVGLTRDDKDLIIEVANSGGRATSLYPVIRVRGRILKFQRRFWYPGGLSRLLPLAWRARGDQLLKAISVPIERASRSEVVMYDIQPNQALRVEPHQGAQEVKATPRGQTFAHPLLYFRVYDVREEGRRRRYRIHTTYEYRRRVSRLVYWYERLRHGVFGTPAVSGRMTLEEWLASQQARD